MDETRGERRAETAKQNDDSDIIEAAEKDSLKGDHQQGSAGGDLQIELGSSVDEQRATDPNRHESVTKSDHIAQGDAESPRHPAEKAVSER